MMLAASYLTVSKCLHLEPFKSEIEQILFTLNSKLLIM